MGLFIKKPLADLMTEANDSGSKSLKRILGPWSLIALGVGVIIGAGLFSITGAVAAGYTGPAITLSFAIAALGCCFAGLCYAEFASMIPVAGSAYTYSYATMGELVAWIIGWDLVLEYCVAATTVSISWSRYLVVFLEGFGVHLPQALTACPWDGGIVNIPALCSLAVAFSVRRKSTMPVWISKLSTVLMPIARYSLAYFSTLRVGVQRIATSTSPSSFMSFTTA